MLAHWIQEESSNAPGRSSVGGTAVLPSSCKYPACGVCKKDLALFFQIELEPRFELPFKPHSQLVVMMCPTCNEALLHEADATDAAEIKLPSNWWTDKSLAHAGLFLFPPGD